MISESSCLDFNIVLGYFGKVPSKSPIRNVQNLSIIICRLSGFILEHLARIPMLIVIFRTGGSEKSYSPCGNAKHVLSFPSPVSISRGVCVFQVKQEAPRNPIYRVETQDMVLLFRFQFLSHLVCVCLRYASDF